MWYDFNAILYVRNVMMKMVGMTLKKLKTTSHCACKGNQLCKQLCPVLTAMLTHKSRTGNQSAIRQQTNR